MPQTIVFIGATSTIAQPCIDSCLAQGKHVTLLGRDTALLTTLSQRVNMPMHVLDCSDIDAVSQCFLAIQQTHTIEAVVCFVGSFMLKPAHLLTSKDWEKTIATNLTSAFAAVHAGTKAMLKTGGNIILLTSAVADIGLLNHEAISAAKAGVIGLAKAAAATYAASGIRVNCVAPGMVRSKLSERILANPQGREISLRAHPLGRVGEPDDVAQVINMLLRSSWITGEVIKVDGGLSTCKIVK